MKHTSSPARASLRAAFLTALALCPPPAAARAAHVTVDCPPAPPLPPGVFNSINAAGATLDNVGPHPVNVIGPCTEAVNIQLRNRITILSTSTTPAVINGLTTPPPNP